MKRAGFTLVELAAAVSMVGVLLALLIPMAARQRADSGLEVSLNNMRHINRAQFQYWIDTAGQAPWRGSRYTNGQLSGWDTWAYGGKNNDLYWLTGTGAGMFDESAYSRPLNAYLTSEEIPVPAGYVNTGSGATWTFNHGTPTPQQRLDLDIPVFRSPGDLASRQRSWPNPSAISCYDDVGTSYMLNMVWWDSITSGSFTFRYNHGVGLIQSRINTPPPNEFIWLSDQVGSVVPDLVTAKIRGEFGDVNRSVAGFLDGRAEYIRLTPGATSGTGYTFIP